MSEIFSNFSLLQSFSLIGLISVIIPILVHLFNPSRGKLVLIGNINLIKKVKNIRIIEVKISRLILLTLRILIFIVLTLILSGLVRNEFRIFSTQTHVFITPGWLNNATEQEKTDLVNEHVNDKTILLIPGMPEIVLTSKQPFSDFGKLTDSDVSTNALLSELSQRNTNQKINQVSEKNIIYLTNRLGQFSNLQSIAVYANKFDWRVKKLTTDSLPNNLSLDIYYSPSRLVDYQFLKLALDTLKNISNNKFIINHYSVKNTNELKIPPKKPSTSDWIFWLNDDLAPLFIKQQVEAGSYLFSDLTDSSEYKPSKSSIPIHHFWIEFYSELPDINNSNTIPVWFNDQGKVVLSAENKGKGKRFQFNSRFHPDWTNITSTVQFPIILAKILNESSSFTKRHQLSETEITSFSDNLQATGLTHQLTDYHSILLLFLCLLWLIERIISERQVLSNE